MWKIVITFFAQGAVSQEKLKGRDLNQRQIEDDVLEKTTSPTWKEELRPVREAPEMR